MIKRLLGAMMFGFFVLALVLYIGGARYPITLSNDFMMLVRSANDRCNEVTFSIPPIPQIPVAPDGGDFLEFLAGVGNFFVNLINAFTAILNAIIAFLTFVVILIEQVTKFLNNAVQAAVIMTP